MSRILEKISRNYQEITSKKIGDYFSDKRFLDNFVKSYQCAKLYWHPRLVYRSLNEVKISNPVFVLGVQGGGLTLTSRVLRLLPDMVYISGNNRYWAGPDELHNNPRFKHLADELVLRSPGYYNMTGREYDHPEVGLERACMYASNEFLAEYRLTDKDWTKALDNQLKQTIKRCIRVYADDVEHARFIDMSQSYIVKIPFLRRCFPDAKFIIVSRDPYAVCWKQALLSPLFSQNPQRAMHYAAENWRNSFYYGLEDTSMDTSTLWLRLEDFLENHLGETKKMYDFLGYSQIDVKEMFAANRKLPLGSIDNKKWLPINRSVNQRHVNQLPDWARDIISNQCGDVMDRLGYVN